MRYISTRGGAPAVGFFDAMLAGLAEDGGLYVPESWPRDLDNDAFRKLAATGSFAEVAARVLKAFAGDDLTLEHAAALTNDAYVGDAQKWHDAVTPLVQIGSGSYVLELFHGPSLSFKDVAMQLIGPLYDHALKARKRRLSVLCATSGDTGGAAAEALKGRDQVDLFILMPKGRVSDVQRYFMTASGASNVHALNIDGDFDDCQALVKGLFADREFANAASLSGVNSINWARIVAQSVYYHVAANTLASTGPVNFVVPTGNFGDAYSGYVAKRMGAPIGEITMATNVNDILARTLTTGRYERQGRSHFTLSPAMDIQVASNFERIVHASVGGDGEHTRRLYQQFAQSDGFDIPAPAMATLRQDFQAESVTDAETNAAMKSFWENGRGYLACPHTAVALHAPRKMSKAVAAPRVTLATAHPAKFPETVSAATGVTPPLPAFCADLFSRRERLDDLPNSLDAVKRYVCERSRACA